MTVQICASAKSGLIQHFLFLIQLAALLHGPGFLLLHELLLLTTLLGGGELSNSALERLYCNMV